MNLFLLFVSIILTFSGLLFMKRVLGKIGVIGFMGIATIIANILICKSVNFGGLSATLDNVMFASNFLATDILTECYGEKAARKGILFAALSIIGFMITTQIALLFVPNEFDFGHESMVTLFSLTPRITLASVSLFILSNIADIKLYAYIKEKCRGEKMWLRNNLCTILCNGSENFIFYFIAFSGVMSGAEIISAGLAATIIETIIALCDTPFLYLAKHVREGTEND